MTHPFAHRTRFVYAGVLQHPSSNRLRCNTAPALLLALSCVVLGCVLNMHHHLLPQVARQGRQQLQLSDLQQHHPKEAATGLSAAESSSVEQHQHGLCGGPAFKDIMDLIPHNLVYMKRRCEYTKTDWSLAISWLLQHETDAVHNLCNDAAKDKHILLYFGSFIHDLLTGLDGSPQGEHIQWHDFYIALLLTGYQPVLLTTSTNLTAEFLNAYDTIISDYTGVAHAMARDALAQHRCKLRILDSYGTDASYNAQQEGGPYCCLSLDLRQFWTFMPNFSPGNDFLGYAVPAFRPVEEMYPRRRWWEVLRPRRHLEVVLYGKEYGFLADHHDYIGHLQKFAPTHATANGWPKHTLPGVQNHGVLANPVLHALMSKTFAYAGFPSVLMGPAAIEAISKGMVFLNYAFDPPWNLSMRQGKPTTQLWHFQFPFLEAYQPHVVTINAKDPSNITKQLSAVRATYRQWWVQSKYTHDRPTADIVVNGHVFLARTQGHRGGFVPYEYTSVAMLLRVDRLMRLNLCASATT